MAYYVTTGLPNGGRTQSFNVQYDKALSTARGLNLATDLMQHCDADLALLSTWFSGRQLDMSLPSLDIDIDRSADWCQPHLIEGTLQTFDVSDLGAFANQTGLSYSWSVTGAAPGATDTPTLTIPVLPAAGTSVQIGVTVTNSLNLRASG
jgi:hypothetical protein